MIAEHHFIKQASHWPNITFRAITYILKLLRGRITGSSLLEGTLYLLRNVSEDRWSFSTAKITDLDDWFLSKLNHNVFWFEISVDDSLLIHVDCCLNYLVCEVENLIYIKFPPVLSTKFLKGWSLTELRQNFQVLLSLVKTIDFYQVLVVE